MQPLMLTICKTVESVLRWPLAAEAQGFWEDSEEHVGTDIPASFCPPPALHLAYKHLLRV
jgi:hypothetical protein